LRAEFGIEVDRHKIELERPIKESGEKEIQVKLHHDVTAALKLDIKSSKPAVVVEESAEPADLKAKPKRRSKPAS
jgi:large subunit ribosomal protein L9